MFTNFSKLIGPKTLTAENSCISGQYPDKRVTNIGGVL